MKPPKSATDMYLYENGPSRHTKFDLIFQICCIITNDTYVKAIEVNFLLSINKLLGNILLLTEHQYYTYNSRYLPIWIWCILCQLGPIPPAQSHIHKARLLFLFSCIIMHTWCDRIQINAPSSHYQFCLFGGPHHIQYPGQILRTACRYKFSRLTTMELYVHMYGCTQLILQTCTF